MTTAQPVEPTVESRYLFRVPDEELLGCPASVLLGNLQDRGINVTVRLTMAGFAVHCDRRQGASNNTNVWTAIARRRSELIAITDALAVSPVLGRA